MTYWNFVVSEVTGLFEMTNSLLNKTVNPTQFVDFHEALKNLTPEIREELRVKEALLDLNDDAFESFNGKALEKLLTEIDNLFINVVKYSQSIDNFTKELGFFSNKNRENNPLNQNNETIYPGLSPT